MRHIQGDYRPKQSHEHRTGTFRVKDGSGTLMAYLSSNQDTHEFWCHLPSYNHPLTMNFELVDSTYRDKAAFCTWLSGQGVTTSMCTLLEHTVSTFECT